MSAKFLFFYTGGHVHSGGRQDVSKFVSSSYYRCEVIFGKKIHTFFPCRKTVNVCEVDVEIVKSFKEVGAPAVVCG